MPFMFVLESKNSQRSNIVPSSLGMGQECGIIVNPIGIERGLCPPPRNYPSDNSIKDLKTHNASSLNFMIYLD